MTAAFGFYFDEPEEWRLVIVSPDVTNLGPREVYGRLFPFLANTGIPIDTASSVLHWDLRMIIEPQGGSVSVR